MKEVIGNLWDTPADWRCITTNAVINRDGELVMGRGCALEAAQKFPGLRKYAARRVAVNGNVVQAVSQHRLILFPVKDRWDQPAKLSLILRSAIRLAELCDEHDLGQILLPRPGCGNGQLDWPAVKAVIENVLPDNVSVITFPPR